MATYKPSQDVLVSGTNIKTVNTSSLLGSGNITAGAPTGGTTGQVLAKNSNTDGDIGWATPSSNYSTGVVLLHTDSVATSGTAISTVLDTNLIFGNYALQNPCASTDKFTCTPFTLAAGTYTFRVDGFGGDANRGKLDWYLDDVRFVTQQDWTTAVNRRDVTGVTVSTSGSHVLRAEINGGTTNYYMCLTRFMFTRTGA